VALTAGNRVVGRAVYGDRVRTTEGRTGTVLGEHVEQNRSDVLLLVVFADNPGEIEKCRASDLSVVRP